MPTFRIYIRTKTNPAKLTVEELMDAVSDLSPKDRNPLASLLYDRMEVVIGEAS